MYGEVRQLTCTYDQPALAQVIESVIKDVSSGELRESLTKLAAAVKNRTALRPAMVSIDGVRSAFETLLPQMLDRDLFQRQHKTALQYLGVSV
jgi:hypothetical protein